MNVVKYQTRLDASNIMEIIDGYDVIVDGVDNFPTRYLLNDATVRLGIPVVSASILGFDGQLNRYVNVYLNDEDVRVLDGLETPVAESDTLVILPAMAGGAN